MDHPQIDEEGIVDRYLTGRLGEDDEARFEKHLFACPECLGQVKVGEDMRLGLRSFAVEETVQASLAIGWWALLRRRALVPALGVAVLALVATSAMLVRQDAEIDRLRQAPALDSSRPMADLFVVSVGVVRDGGAAPLAVRADPDQEALLLSLELPLEEPSVDEVSYRLILSGGGTTGEETLWRGEGLQPSFEKTLTVIVPTSFLTPGRYRLRVEKVSPQGSDPVGEIEVHWISNE